MLLADVLVAASELPSGSAAPDGDAGLPTAHVAARPAASSADDAQPEESTPPGAPNAHLPCNGVNQYHASHSSAANHGLFYALGIHEGVNWPATSATMHMCCDQRHVISKKPALDTAGFCLQITPQHNTTHRMARHQQCSKS